MIVLHEHWLAIVDQAICPVCKTPDFRRKVCRIRGCGFITNENVGDHAHQSPGVEVAIKNN